MSCETTGPVRTLADIEAMETIPFDQRVGVPSTYAMIARQVAKTPDNIALSFFLTGDQYATPQDVTYAQLLGRIHQTANLFDDLGLGSDDVVSILLPNLPHAHFAIWGGEARGIMNPINPMLDAAVIRDILRAAKTKVLVALGEFPGSDIWPKVQSIRGDLPDLKAIVRVMGPSDEAEGIVGYDQVIDNYPADRLTFERDVNPDTEASIFHTGGTTGTPKLARHSHRNELHVAWAITKIGDFHQNDSLLCGLPLFHTNGVFVTGLAPFSVGARVVLATPLGYRDKNVMVNFFKIVEHYKATFFSAVPTVYAALLQLPMGDVDISSLRYAICGAAPMPIEVFNAFEKATGMKILEGYGLTEGGVVSSINPRDGDRKVGSIGIRIPYQEMTVVRVDEKGKWTGDCDTDEIGTIAIKGSNVFPGYKEDVHNIGIWLDEQQTWLNTGDMGRRDADDFFWLTGRKKELIIRGGHNIDPAMIESGLLQVQGVAMAAAIGRPDAYAGEVPMVFVALKPGCTLTEADLLEKAKELIKERAAVPKEVVILPELPVTAVGKIFKPKLRWEATRRVYRKELAALEDQFDSIDVEVREDKQHGTKAWILARAKADTDTKELEEKIQSLLGRYTIRAEVLWQGAPLA